MTRPRRIAVLFHRKDRGRKIASYVIHDLAESWRQMGHDVVFLFGTARMEPAELVLVHVDLSVVPDEYLAFAARYPTALNGCVKNIKKSTFSESRLTPSDGWDGPVIVKTDLNNAGRPERVNREPVWLRRRPRMLKAWRFLDSLGEIGSPMKSEDHYLVYDHLHQVPLRCFNDRRLIVEKFIPEMEDGLYFIRTFHFLGDRWTCTRLGSPDPLVKARTTTRWTEVDPPAEVDTWRQRFNLDYGKLDYVMVGDRAVLLDINKTTGSTELVRPVDPPAHRQYRAQGIESYFRNLAPAVGGGSAA